MDVGSVVCLFVMAGVALVSYLSVRLKVARST